VEAEFVNVYISKQKAWIEDLTARYIMLDTKLQLAEARMTQLAEQNTLLNSRLEKLEKQNGKKKVDSVENSF
jgi:cell division protein FtsB